MENHPWNILERNDSCGRQVGMLELSDRFLLEYQRQVTDFHVWFMKYILQEVAMPILSEVVPHFRRQRLEWYPSLHCHPQNTAKATATATRYRDANQLFPSILPFIHIYQLAWHTTKEPPKTQVHLAESLRC